MYWLSQVIPRSMSSQHNFLWYIICCGVADPKCLLAQENVRKQKLSALLETHLPQSSLEEWRAGQPLVCIDFGSMGCLGLIPDSHYLVAVLVAALQQAGAKGILLTGVGAVALCAPGLFQEDIQNCVDCYKYSSVPTEIQHASAQMLVCGCVCNETLLQ